MNEVERYVQTKREIGLVFQGRYAGQKQKIANHLLDLAYDWVSHRKRHNLPMSRFELEDYLKSKQTLNHKDLGISAIFLWWLLRIILKWIINKVL